MKASFGVQRQPKVSDKTEAEEEKKRGNEGKEKLQEGWGGCGRIRGQGRGGWGTEIRKCCRTFSFAR